MNDPKGIYGLCLGIGGQVLTMVRTDITFYLGTIFTIVGIIYYLFKLYHDYIKPFIKKSGK